MDVCRRLGRNIRALRERTGLSQEAFADHVGLHRTYISDLERGTRNPTVRVVEKIALALGTEAGSLLD
ncbi:putative regulatory protein [Sphingomonas changbaiensis NBRC 104936]|uniref:Putative regulatory protein n=1 Tax=Sphingomonas changbaiensis NBRC 104936 TaxID=1219043 RepID=A0A0E9MP59_9SPHN|nr:helix-turn-helix transcriptional regulator [Sphingomonas changbaiensis]GAO39221.1 putative regulatory protein [Sphingomonas changbaiensis NBRC 104936]